MSLISSMVELLTSPSMFNGTQFINTIWTKIPFHYIFSRRATISNTSWFPLSPLDRFQIYTINFTLGGSVVLNVKWSGWAVLSNYKKGSLDISLWKLRTMEWRCTWSKHRLPLKTSSSPNILDSDPTMGAMWIKKGLSRWQRQQENTVLFVHTQVCLSRINSKWNVLLLVSKCFIITVMLTEGYTMLNIMQCAILSWYSKVLTSSAYFTDCCYSKPLKLSSFPNTDAKIHPPVIILNSYYC